MRGFAALAFVAIFVLDVPFPLIVLAAALIGFFSGRAGYAAFKGGGGHGPAGAEIIHDRDTALGEGLPDHARPNLSWSLRISGVLLLLWLGPVAALLFAFGPDDVFSRIATFFSQMAVVTFGGAYAVLAYVAQEAVETYGWLQPGEMLDGLGMAETTPGPLIMVTQFVAFLAAFRQATGLAPAVAAPFRAIPPPWATFPDDVFSRIATFFSQMAVVTVGGAYAVLAYVAQEAVETYGWLQPGEMLDGLGMAETTPGPLIMVTQFVGFLAAFREATGLPPLVAATFGAILTTWVTFLPCFLWIFAGAPFIERLRGNRALSAALSAITAAVVGVILNLAVWFGIHTLFEQVREVPFAAGTIDLPVLTSVNWPALALAVGAILAMFRFKAGMLPVLGVCSVLGAAYVMII